MPVPAPWKPYQVVAFDGLVWVVAKGAEVSDDGTPTVVFVNRPVPKPRVLSAEETEEAEASEP